MIRIWTRAMITAVALASAGAAHAATPAKMVAGCTDRSAFGFTFGEAPPSGAAPLEKTAGYGFVVVEASDLDMGPFQQFELQYDLKTSRLFAVIATAHYETDALAKQSKEEAAKAALSDRRFFIADASGFPYNPKDGVAYTFLTDRSDADYPKDLELEVFSIDERVSVACIQRDLF